MERVILQTPQDGFKPTLTIRSTPKSNMFIIIIHLYLFLEHMLSHTDHMIQIITEMVKYIYLNILYIIFI